MRSKVTFLISDSLILCWEAAALWEDHAATSPLVRQRPNLCGVGPFAPLGARPGPGRLPAVLWTGFGLHSLCPGAGHSAWPCGGHGGSKTAAQWEAGRDREHTLDRSGMALLGCQLVLRRWLSWQQEKGPPHSPLSILSCDCFWAPLGHRAGAGMALTRNQAKGSPCSWTTASGPLPHFLPHVAEVSLF